MTPEEMNKALALTLLSAATVALILAVSKNQVIEMIRQGRLEAIDVGVKGRPLYRVKTESVKKILEGVA